MDKEMTYGENYHYLPATSLLSGTGEQVLEDVLCHTIQIVNVCMIGLPGEAEWVLIDAGMPKSADAIIHAASERFGPNQRPKGILLTHGHFDHVGAIIELINHWNVPVYAHELEMPYLTGKKSYPPPDPTADEGLIAKLSVFFPNSPIDLGQHVNVLPADGTIPILEGWRWLHTQGHTPGHISLFRDMDRTLIVGDAFVTVKQESIYKVFVQKQEISGPPKYFTMDWEQARQTVERLEKLQPRVAITGHGRPLIGDELSQKLSLLSEQFDELAVPDKDKLH